MQAKVLELINLLKDDGWSQYVPDLPGCIAAGESKEEVLALVHKAIEFHIEGLKEDGLPVPPPASYSELADIAA